MDEKALKILAQSTELFMQYGIKSLTMDDIARHLGISKKTLYQSFSDKAELVYQGMLAHMKHEQDALNTIHEQSENAIEEMFLISQHVSKHIQSMHPSILFDLEKYYPEAFQEFQNYKLKYIMGCIARNIEDGIAQGFYRKNMNIPVVAALYVARMDVLFDQKLFPSSQFSLKDVYFEAIRYHIRGIASEKGIEYLKNKFKTLDTQHPIF
ncbi:MAG: TetR/AcrR family transcriptional regulator [Bacteroidetes bacterium]|nr:MAG: TetR/AcrR family transcriptional regulator [Bacteroidota bacterium]